MRYVASHKQTVALEPCKSHRPAGILTMIMVRTLRRDIARYNAGESDSLASLDETIEETGWKLVHGDVFRPPINSRLFAAVIGSGIQIFFMALITICKITSSYVTKLRKKVPLMHFYALFAVFAMLGMLSPASRGALGTCAIFLYVFSGLVAGYFSARLYKTMRGREWRRAALLVRITCKDVKNFPLDLYKTSFD